MPAGQRVTLIATNFTPVDFTAVTSGNVVVTTSFKVSGGLSAISSGTRAVGYGPYSNSGTAADYADDSGYFTWLNGRQTGSLIELRRRNGNAVSPSLLNPAGTAFASLGTGATTQTAGVLSDGATYAIQLQLIRTATGAYGTFNHNDCGEDTTLREADDSWSFRTTRFFPAYPGCDWALLRSWAWGVSRIVDYLVT